MRCDLFRLLLSPSRRGVLRVGADVILRSPLADEFLCPIIELIHEEELPFVMPHKRDSEVIAKIEYLSPLAAQKRAQHGQLAAEINHIDGEIAAFNFIRERYVIQGEDASRRLPVTQKASLETKIDILTALLQTKGIA